MDLGRALLYGIVQGVMGWLPVSSLAHLQIIKVFLDPQIPTNQFTASIAVIQIGTTVAVVAYFWKDLGHAIGAWAKSLRGIGRDSVDARIGWGVFYGSLPMVLLVPFHKQIEGQAVRDLRVIATLFIVVGIFMWAADRYGKRSRGMADVQPKDGWLPGFFQIFAGVPGVSRSGVTIAGALIAGLDMQAAARFSFLMSVPSVVGAGIFELVQYRHEILGSQLAPVAVGMVAAAISGYATIAFLLKYLQRNGLMLFVVYRFAMGAVLWAIVLGGYAPKQAADTNSAALTISRPVAMR